MKDPICGMEVQDTKFNSAYKGKQYNFCSSRCKETFDKSPDKYAKDNIDYQCSICKLHYKDEILADRCNEWCSTHKSCNLEIAWHSIEANKGRKKTGE
jgi:YHS domain-containing protein